MVAVEPRTADRGGRVGKVGLGWPACPGMEGPATSDGQFKTTGVYSCCCPHPEEGGWIEVSVER